MTPWCARGTQRRLWFALFSTAVLAPNGSGGVPSLVLSVADIAGAGWDAVGVKVCILIQWDDVGGVVGAKYVAAMAAVVFAYEEVEGVVAVGTVAGR